MIDVSFKQDFGFARIMDDLHPSQGCIIITWHILKGTIITYSTGA
jgi:hypothetical protein